MGVFRVLGTVARVSERGRACAGLQSLSSQWWDDLARLQPTGEIVVTITGESLDAVAEIQRLRDLPTIGAALSCAITDELFIARWLKRGWRFWIRRGGLTAEVDFPSGK